MSASHITTHILDTAAGRPAPGVTVELAARSGDGWTTIATGQTDSDGRARDLGAASQPAGDYRLTFFTGDYFASQGVSTFFPEVSLVFTLADIDEHYHVPLLLSPFAYSTYRGS
ncbi:hydroxyisourate hydrolase [Salinisphaera sp. USBA-960]|uniref:hydroxyisourate hydrolase n=1 Tax=Salinisphaera orenii TaxID=856731 RepID=UPI000DBE628B|nr:hydroxyisourate hydrolase [Salifodinibacter halophilus]NNC26513.1 hydroxyisourate hydrolase [Salifodinibacter halophilus]